MLLLVGQVPRAFRGREAWQELDYAQVFGGVAKAAWEIDGAERIPEHMAEAYAIAISGRPGPSSSRCPRTCSPSRRTLRTGRASRRRVSRRPQTSSRGCASSSRRPSGLSSSSAREAGRPRRSRDVQAFCEANALPVACAFRCQDYVDNRSPSYVGRARRGDGRGDRRAAARRGPRARDRRASRRGADAPLLPARGAGSTADARPRPSRPGRARSRLRAGPRDRGDAAGGGCRAASARARRAALGRVDGRRPRRVRGEPRPRADGGRRRPRRDHGVPARAPSG